MRRRPDYRPENECGWERGECPRAGSTSGHRYTFWEHTVTVTKLPRLGQTVRNELIGIIHAPFPRAFNPPELVILSSID
jgi:hypothetical protein